MLFPKELFEKVDFEKSADDSKAWKITQHANSELFVPDCYNMSKYAEEVYVR